MYCRTRVRPIVAPAPKRSTLVGKVTAILPEPWPIVALRPDRISRVRAFPLVPSTITSTGLSIATIPITDAAIEGVNPMIPWVRRSAVEWPPNVPSLLNPNAQRSVNPKGLGTHITSHSWSLCRSTSPRSPRHHTRSRRRQWVHNITHRAAERLFLLDLLGDLSASLTGVSITPASTLSCLMRAAPGMLSRKAPGPVHLH